MPDAIVSSMKLHAADHAGVRRNNLSLVLRLLHGTRDLSRAAVAVQTGLNKATVSSLVNDLIDRGLVKELGIDDQLRVGRPATLLELDGRQVASIGLEINVDLLTVVVMDLGGRILFQRERPIDIARLPLSRTMTTLTSMARQAHEKALRLATTVTGITVAVPGLVDAATGTVAIAPNLHIHHLELGDRLAEALGRNLKVTIDNDANLAALAEYHIGDFAGTPNLIYITGQTGVGGGLVVDGELLRGAAGFSGEVGHMHIGPDDHLCGCGRRGCWEALVGLKQLLREALPDQASELEAQKDKGPQAKVAAVVDRAVAEDPVALAALGRHAAWLGVGLSILVNLFNPQVVILGGFFRDIGPWVLPVANSTMRDYTIAPDAGGCQIVTSSLGFSAAAAGAAIHAAERVFDDPALVPIAAR
jgi:predicted NBD/HSP70 family sugar kinase